MLVKMAEVLVKIAVMMMAPGGVPAPPEARGREPPFFFFFLDLLPRWEKGFPSGPWPPWRGRGESPSEIGSVSLSVSAFRSAALSPFRIYMEIRNSDWTETFAVIFLPKISFLAAEGGHQPPYGWPTRVRGAPPCLVATSGTVSRGFFFRNFPNIPKIISVRLSRLDSV